MKEAGYPNNLPPLAGNDIAARTDASEPPARTDELTCWGCPMPNKRVNNKIETQIEARPTLIECAIQSLWHDEIVDYLRNCCTSHSSIPDGGSSPGR